MRKIFHVLPKIIMILIFISPVFLSACFITDAFQYALDTVRGNTFWTPSWEKRKSDLPPETELDILKSYIEAEKEIQTQREIQAQIQAQIEATAEAALIEGFTEEEMLLPNEPVSYQGNVDGVSVTLVIGFKSADVSGTLSLLGDDYAEAEIGGDIDLVTFKVTAVFSGTVGSKEHGMSYPWAGTIEGVVSPDLNAFTGLLVDNEGEVRKVELQR